MTDAATATAAVTATGFAAAVLTRSAAVPVVVDFWAAWCGPCRTIAPVLERLAVEYAGRADVVKVDADAETELTARYGVRSLPTIAVFRGGALADAVIGAQPEAVLRELIERHLERPGDHERAAALAAAAAGDTDAAVATLERLAAAEPDRPQHYLALLDVLIAAGRLEAAALRIGQAPLSFEGSREFEARRARLEIAAAAADVAADPAAAQHRAAARQFLAGSHEPALEGWLELMRRHPRYGNGAAQRALRAAFQLLGEHHALAVSGRRRMAALLH